MATMIDKDVQGVALLEGERLTVTIAAVGTALVERYDANWNFLEKVSLTAGQVRVFGEYDCSIMFRISCLTGTLTYTAALNTNETGDVGTQTNDNAAAGAVGEYTSITVPIGTPVAETTATPVNVTSLALAAGDWEVSGTVNRVLTGVTATQYAAAISPTANTIPAQAGGSGVAADSVVTQNATFGSAVSGNYITAVGPVRVSLASAATIYLVAADTFSLGTIGLFGTLRARRVR